MPCETTGHDVKAEKNEGDIVINELRLAATYDPSGEASWLKPASKKKKQESETADKNE